MFYTLCAFLFENVTKYKLKDKTFNIFLHFDLLQGLNIYVYTCSLRRDLENVALEKSVKSDFLS